MVLLDAFGAEDDGKDVDDVVDGGEVDVRAVSEGTGAGGSESAGECKDERADGNCAG